MPNIPLGQIKETQARRDHGDLTDLQQSINAVGLINPLTIDESGKLLAGRRRYAALVGLGWEEAPVRVLPTDGDQLLAFRVALHENLARKNLTDPEMAAAIKDYDELKRQLEGERDTRLIGRDAFGRHSVASEVGWTQGNTAEDLGISRQAVGKAIQIAETIERYPELAQRVSGQAILLEGKRRTWETNTSAWPVGTYAVIYADPPWQYDNAGLPQSAASHYRTMSVPELTALPIPNLCLSETVLFLWATSSMLPVALEVLQGWGFVYKANMVWDKGRSPGLGWFLETQHELVLIGTREANLHPKIKPASVFKVAPLGHSAKPTEVYDIIESMYAGPYLELFARSQRDGWKVWGNEV